MSDLDIYFKDEEKKWKKGCSKTCSSIEYMLSSWAGRKQMKLLRDLGKGRITKGEFENEVSELTKKINNLAETSILQRSIFDEG